MRRSNARSQALDPNSTAKMDASKLQFRSPAVFPSRFSLFSRLSSPPISKHSRGNVWIPISAAAALILFLYLFIVSKSYGEKRFGIIIDGGSSGTRIHVFAYLIGKGLVPVFDFGATATMKVNPGLSSYSGDPERAGESLIELLEFAKARVPKDMWGDTEIRLMATAGLRLLDTRLQDRILGSCRTVLRTSSFRFQNDWATVITGLDEGIYAWITANYALGTLGGDPQQTTGIIELGGASAQVTFVSGEPVPTEFSHVLRYGKTTYNLYSHSFLHFGQNVAYESLRELLSSMQLKPYGKSLQEGIVIDPCAPRGYSHAGEIMKPYIKGHLPTYRTIGNFSECRSAALVLLQKGNDNCSYEHCHLGSTFIPELQGKFIATENFFYTLKFFGLSSSAFLSDLMVAGQRFCGEDWLKLKWKYHDLDEEDLLRYCFSSAYIVALLHDSLGISLDDRRITVANQIGNVPLDWALGAFIMQKMSHLSAEHTDWITRIIRDDCSALISLFVLSSILIFTAWSVSKWRKPQLKTIYDLEKGRYIVTRVVNR